MSSRLPFLLLAVMPLACGALDDEPARNDAVRDLYGPNAVHAQNQTGARTLTQVNSLNQVMETTASFTAAGDIVVQAVPSAISTSSPSVRQPTGWLGGRPIGFLLSTRAAGPQCTLGNRWRTLADGSLGLLVDCSDGVSREAVLRPATPSQSTRCCDEHVLASVGGEPAGTPSVATTPIEPQSEAPWDSARFWFANAR